MSARLSVLAALARARAEHLDHEAALLDGAGLPDLAADTRARAAWMRVQAARLLSHSRGSR